MELETPLLCSTTATDPHIASITTQANYYLQTSPEFAMKRALAAGSGCIYQICKAFRADESGRFHNPEFTMLEWYRLGFDHHDLMDEMDELLIAVLKTKPAARLSYAELFQHYLGLNPHRTTKEDLINCASQHNLRVELTSGDRDDWLHILLTHLIEPTLGLEKPVFIYDYPVTQAALARIRQDTFPVAERFEVYYKGIELANGFHELTNAAEQKQRFMADLQRRRQLGLANVPVDARLLMALAHGLPDCAGVALGIDRLIMLAIGATSIQEVLSFPWGRV